MEKNIYTPIITGINSEYIQNYIELTNQYILYCVEKINKSNIKRFDIILEKGLHINLHVFTIALTHTKNIETTISMTQNGFFNYLEFIDQTSNNTVNNVLNLTSKDAQMYVYKKTIFELDQNIRKNNVITPQEELYLSEIFEVCKLYNLIWLDINSILLKNKTNINEQMYVNIISKNQKLMSFIFKKVKDQSNLKYILLFVYNLIKFQLKSNVKIDNIYENLYKIIEVIIQKKYSLDKFTIENINSLLYKDRFKFLLNKNNIKHFITIFMSEINEI